MLTRREFLRVSTLLGTGALLAACAPDLSNFAKSETETLRRLLILYTNDEHGWIEANGEIGGAARLAHLWRKIEGHAPDAPTLALSGGDLWTGPAISTYSQGEAMIDIMNALDYKAAAIGNHDFDDGLEVLRKRAKQAKFPLLSANLREKSTGATPDFALPYITLDVNGIRLGLIGLTTRETPVDTQPAHVADYEFLPYHDTLVETVPQVKAEGAQLLAVLGHICTAEMRLLAPLAAELGIAFLFGGHCHEETIETLEGVTLVQSGSFLRGYSRLALLFDTVSGKVVEIAPSLQPNRKGREDADMAAQVTSWRERMDPSLWEVIGYAQGKIGWNSPEMAVLLTRPWLKAYPAAQLALAAPRYVQSLPPGEISRASILSMLPTDNELVDMRLSGAQIIETIEAKQPLVGNLFAGQAGYEFADGTPLNPDSVYHVLIPNALYEGGNYYTVKDFDPNATYTGLNWRTPIEAWIASLKTSKNNPLEAYLRA